jgi:hypothetical protein
MFLLIRPDRCVCLKFSIRFRWRMMWEFPTKGNSLNGTRICKYKNETIRENLSVLEKKLHVNDYRGLHLTLIL